MFGPKRLTEILSSFQKTIDDLNGLEVANDAAVQENEVKIASLALSNVELRTESASAAKIRGKIVDLVSA